MSASAASSDRRGLSPVSGEAFEDAASAWFWAVSALLARREGFASAGGKRVPRPCDPEDVLVQVDRLLTSGLIGPAHARVLRIWGARGIPPHPANESLWKEALARLEEPLRFKGIVKRRK